MIPPCGKIGREKKTLIVIYCRISSSYFHWLGQVKRGILSLMLLCFDCSGQTEGSIMKVFTLTGSGGEIQISNENTPQEFPDHAVSHHSMRLMDPPPTKIRNHHTELVNPTNMYKNLQSHDKHVTQCNNSKFSFPFLSTVIFTLFKTLFFPCVINDFTFIPCALL